MSVVRPSDTGDEYDAQAFHGTAIFAYIGVVWGANVGIHGSPMERLGWILDMTCDGVFSLEVP